MTRMHCVKLPGQRRPARDFNRPVAAFQVRVAVFNGFTTLGTPVTDAVGQVCPGKGQARPSPDLSNKAGGPRHADIENSEPFRALPQHQEPSFI